MFEIIITHIKKLWAQVLVNSISKVVLLLSLNNIVSESQFKFLKFYSKPLFYYHFIQVKTFFQICIAILDIGHTYLISYLRLF